MLSVHALVLSWRPVNFDTLALDVDNKRLIGSIPSRPKKHNRSEGL